ncbi:hypothetical protein OTU49_000128, partial [Cherax quadricarinatus]
EDTTLEEVCVADLAQVLIEVRNKDLTWPEEMSQIASTRLMRTQSSQGVKEKGVTGLNNLGNTCFLNAALQCCSNTHPLTTYFINNMHLYELNPDNPCGMKGHMARQYGNLMQELWGGGARTVAPLKLRAWENHILRNKSIIVDLFHGQLKSKVTCRVCGNESARFDPFTYLTLQLPMESFVYLEVIVVKLDGSVPVKYGLRLNSDSRYYDVKQHLHILTGIPPHQIMLSELANAQIKYIPMDEGRVRTVSGSALFAYELPSPTSFHSNEVRSASRSPRDRHVFTHIQRSTHHSSPCLREAVSSPFHSSCTTESIISSPSSLELTSSRTSLQSSHLSSHQ